jgi:hypothetical protein
MIQSLLIANRGENAHRIIRTQFLPGTGRGTSEAGGGASAGYGSTVAANFRPATPPSFGWSPSPAGRGFAIQTPLIASDGPILPGTGRGTMRSMVEGHGRVQRDASVGRTHLVEGRLTSRRRENCTGPLHQLRWSPSPVGGRML